MMRIGSMVASGIALCAPASWLTSSGCLCDVGLAETPAASELRTAAPPPTIAARVDLVPDGVIDWRDVAIFERNAGLPDVLSRAIRRSSWK